MTVREIAEIAGVSVQTVRRTAELNVGYVFEKGKKADFSEKESIEIMRELKKKGFIQPVQNGQEPVQNGQAPVQNAEVATQNAKVSFLSEKDIAIISQIVSVTVSETIKALDGRMTNIEQKIEQRKILLPAPQLDARAHIKKMIDEYVSRNGIEHSDAYRYLYREFFYRTKCNASLCAKNRGMKTIDYIDDEGMIETLEAIAMEVL